MKNNLIAKLSKAPYRGIMAEIAKEQNVTRQAIHDAIYKHQNPRIIQIAANKANARKYNLKRLENALSTN